MIGCHTCQSTWQSARLNHTLRLLDPSLARRIALHLTRCRTAGAALAREGRSLCQASGTEQSSETSSQEPAPPRRCDAAFNKIKATCSVSEGQTATVKEALGLLRGRSRLSARFLCRFKDQPEGVFLARKRILSGVQPTGSLHLGNYLGAIRNWVTLQDLYDTYFCVVDMHAITLPHDPKELKEASRRSAAIYLACGIDPVKSNIFIQSHVPAHAELTWLLSCVTPIGWLRRMTQFKEKSKSQGEEVGTGLLTYPVLMAADILLYQADLVPVGEDQVAHIELTRDIAERVNKRFGGNKWKKLGGRGGRIFRIPEGFIPPAGARVMSLTDGSAKMSKSAELDISRINLLDDAKTIISKVKKAKTDAFEGLELDNPERPESRNLLTIYQLMTGYSKESVVQEVGQLNWGAFKPKLAEATIAHLEPIQKTYNEVMEDAAVLDKVLADGADIANEIANNTLENCRQAMGFTPRF